METKKFRAVLTDVCGGETIVTEETTEFVVNDVCCFKRDVFIKTFFEKIFCTKILAAFADKPLYPNHDKLTLSGNTVYLFINQDQYIEIDVSEWASIQMYHNERY